MAKYQLLLPKMGESVAEATVIKWNKKPGDHVDADEAVMEIATDKVDSDVPSPVAGKLVEQFYQENDVVQVGAVIAIIETAEAEVSNSPVIVAPEPETFTEHTPVIEHVPFNEPVAPAVEEQPLPVVETPSFTAPVVTEQEPDTPAPLDIPGISQLEQQVPSPYSQSFKGEGRFYSPLVRNIASQEGISINELDTIPGTGSEGRLTKDDLLSYIQYKHSPAAVQKTEAPGEVTTAPVTTASVTAETQTVEPTVVAVPDEEPVATPIAEPVVVTEPAVVAEPVVAAEPAATPEPENIPEPVKEKPVETKPVTPLSSVSGADEIIEMDRMRRLIADHMVMSKQTSPHVTSFVEADVTSLVMWREKIKNSFEKREGEKITFTPIFIEAVVKAIKDFPMINVTVNGTQIIKKAAINISMATALPSGNLIVPVIKKADELNLLGITKAVNDLASRARNGKLLPDDVKEGTFTITNVGSFGNVMGTPIINQPQVAILAVGAIKKKPAVIETAEGDVIAIRHMMFLSLSYDHRVVDGALGGSFVRRVADYLEKWDGNRVV
ncbi:dihydrolipoamide acetyltransferase family protein [Mucilaginibacter flavus]|uniref:dihydrolipoamide acetyltransferase family protein n=1 Tax=Mucilaginibacter flavus TaxID=931504 RepID=UPI0025B47099|nr:2-oxo acid dehydrogenase subunit E2 [Mucilaginibacter flavus]MDN3583088.1 2-oxo acid dehydrogenase subunit E2 [Mucilaginibacter flavus]